MFKQIKQIRITLMTMFKVYPSPANELRWSVANDSEHGWLMYTYCLFCAWLPAWCCGLGQVPLFTSNLDNCNEVNSRLPHRAHISKVSCFEAICSWVNIYKHPTGFCFDCAKNVECWHPGTILHWRLVKNKHSSCLRVNISCSKSDARVFSNTFDGDYNSSLSDN